MHTSNQITRSQQDQCLPASAPMRRRFSRFARDEDGSMIALTLFIFIFMLVMGGLGIDTMRHEMNRAHLQATLDSAVLAGANASTNEEAKTIVEDYFAKSGMAQYLNDIGENDIDIGLTSAYVTASAGFEMDTYLMKLSGVDTLSGAAKSTAQMRIPRLEIALVLDVSGSMRDNSKLENLKTAAKDFISKTMSSANAGNVVISVVPFSTSVTPTDGIYDVLAVGEDHTYSNCLYLEENDYSHPALATGTSANSEGQNLKQAIYTSLYGGFDNLNQDWRSCYTDEYFQIMPYSISVADLHAKIDGLKAAGATSTDQGIKYGSALLHPSWREVSASLISNNLIDASLTNVPVDYNDPETLKIMIVMGDGENTKTYFFDKSSPKYRGAHSDLHMVEFQDTEFQYAYRKKNKDRIYTDPSYESNCSSNKWVCFYEATGPVQSVYYLEDVNPIDHTGDGIVDTHYNIEAGTWHDANYFGNLSNTIQGFISSDQLSWETAWGLITPEFYGQTTDDWGPWNDYVGSESIDGHLKNVRMGNVCGAARRAGTIIYTIGFEINEGGTAETALKDCASSDSHYYRVEGLDITDAFGSIAGNVQALRLTQ